MENKKGNVTIATIAAILFLTAAVFIWFVVVKNDLMTNVSNQPKKIKTERITDKSEGKFMTPSGEWKEITHVNFWKNKELFSGSEYNFADIKFSYPSNWNFDCCNDMDDRSSHFIFSSANSDMKLPFITIVDYNLMGCPVNKTNCSIDEIVKKTPKEKYEEIIKAIEGSKKIKPEKMLTGLNISAFNYETIDKDGIKIDSYIFKTAKNVVEVSFANFNVLEAGFADDFLGKIKKD